MNTDMALITCGRRASADGPELETIMAHLRESMDGIWEQIARLKAQDPGSISMLGPFLGRSLLDLASTAMIARLDPLRVLVIRKIQEQSDYDPDKPWKTSIRWQGDVLAEKAEKAKDIWSIEYKQMTKAILGDYYDHLVWRPAFQRFLDSPAARSGSSWTLELQSNAIQSFVPEMRERMGRLYSYLSKGIHHEFVIPVGVKYDRKSIEEKLSECIKYISVLGLVSHFVEHAIFSLDHEEAVETFNRIETIEVMR